MKPFAEPARRKVHWDYVLEEMKWMANDFWQVRGVGLLGGAAIGRGGRIWRPVRSGCGVLSCVVPVALRRPRRPR